MAKGSLHMIDYDSARKKKGVWTPASTQIHLESVVLHDRSQTQNTAECVVLFV